MKAILPLLLLVAACGSPTGEPATTLTTTTSTTTTTTMALAEPELVMIISELGGCAWMGPNCATFGLWSDGTAAVYRMVSDLPADTLDQSEAEAVASIGTELTAQLTAISDTTDFDDLEARLGPGNCNACVDGIDYLLTLYTDAGPQRFSSSEFEFDQTETLFRAVENALIAMSQKLQLSVETHS